MDLEREVRRLPGRENGRQKIGAGYEGVIWDDVTKHFTIVRSGPKGSDLDERGIYVLGDNGGGNMPYSSSGDRYYRLDADQFRQYLQETLRRCPTEEEIAEALKRAGYPVE